MTTIYDLVMQSGMLQRDIERFADINAVDSNGTECECYMLGYVRAVHDICQFAELDIKLILKVYEKQ